MSAQTRPTPPYRPYSSDAANDIYNLLFCDDASAFLPKPGVAPTPWQSLLAAAEPDRIPLHALASDEKQDGRVRYLAFRRLRERGHPVVAKQLLGVVVEVPLEGGLDTLAAYTDGGARYINHTGRMIVAENVPAIAPIAAKLLATSNAVVKAIGPWDGARRPPPGAGGIRITFLVSDGLYFGEGPFAALQRDALGGPVIQAATELLNAMIALDKPATRGT